MIQPEGSSLCGHCCVAMAARVSLRRAVGLIGHEGATTAQELAEALGNLGVKCSTRLRRISRARPALPKRALVVVGREGEAGRRDRRHWLLAWDGEIVDPGGRMWPKDYANWRMTSYLEIE